MARLRWPTILYYMGRRFIYPYDTIVLHTHTHTHTHSHIVYYTRGVSDTFFSSFFVPRFFHSIIILYYYYYYCVVSVVYTLASPARSFFPITAWLSNGCCRYTHTHTQNNRRRRPTAPLEYSCARAFVCMWFTSDNHGPSLIVFIYHTVQSRCPYIHIQYTIYHIPIYQP